MKKYLTAALLCCLLLLSACTTPEQNTTSAGSTLQKTPQSPSEQYPAQTEVMENGAEQFVGPALPGESTDSRQHSEGKASSESWEPYCDTPEDVLSPSSPPESEPTISEEPMSSTLQTEGYPAQPSEPTIVPEPVPIPTEDPKPIFDIQEWIAFAQNYGLGIGLTYDFTATECWDNPIIASAKSVYLERDIKSRLDLYAADGITYFCVWAQLRADGRYDLYIGYA